MLKQRRKHDHTPRMTWDEIRTWSESLNDHTTRETRRAERAEEEARSIRIRCAWGNCVNYYDPKTNRITWGFGAVGCPCDNLPGWKGRHPEMLAKPAWPTKAVGRNGSRVQRSRRRHRNVGKSGYMKWAEAWEENNNLRFPEEFQALRSIDEKLEEFEV
jgi:hypothetical protein